MKLATFETIDEIFPIEGKDRIVTIAIKGFELVVQKDRFSVGDTCVYVPPDTIIDRTKPWFTSFKADRVKTEKIAGVYSQGIALTLSELENVIPNYHSMTEEESDSYDLGGLIGVSKYEKDLFNLVYSDGNRKRTNDTLPLFPSHLIPITDEPNLKSVKGRYKDLLMNQELCDKDVNVTLKMDGTSTTLIWHSIDDEGKFCETDSTSKNGDIFIMASRNFSLYKNVYTESGVHNEFDYPDDKTTYIKKYKLMDRFRGKNIAIQGELCGPKIGGNKMGFDKHEFFVFTVLNLDTKEYYSYDEIVDLCKNNELTPVPLIERLTVTPETDLKYFQEMADQIKYTHPKTGVKSEGEGIVVRPVKPFSSKGLGNNSTCLRTCSFKLINKKYKD